MIEYKAIGRRIKERRKFCSISQKILADKLSVTDKYISQIECGVAEISLKRIFDIAKILKTKPEYFIFGIDAERPNYLSTEIYNKINELDKNKKEFIIKMIESVREI